MIPVPMLVFSFGTNANADTFFGVPGGPVAPIFKAVLQDPRARLIESRHETAGAFDAAGFYFIKGTNPLGLCFTFTR